MKICKSLIVILIGMVSLAYAGFAVAKISPEEAAKLGTTLTGIGAEMAGNADGTIPAYTGGLPVSDIPKSFKEGDLFHPDPFAAEKPLFSITAANMGQYADRLSETAKMLFKKNPGTFRIDVYKTHRSIRYPAFVFENTKKVALTANLTEENLKLENSRGGIPFPIPKNGSEAMWNHQVGYVGVATEGTSDVWMVGSSGKPGLISKAAVRDESPYWDPDSINEPGPKFFSYYLWVFDGPPRIVGEAGLARRNMDGRGSSNVYLYFAGQRRVRLAPEFSFDGPSQNQGGIVTYDDDGGYCGSQVRYDFKLIGKKEMYVPYNAYRAAYGNPEETLGPAHMEPDVLRWELHRVWVVEATLKPGMRHLYKKRVFYLDEDCWKVNMYDNYDAQDKLFRGGLRLMDPMYDAEAPTAGASNGTLLCFDFNANMYVINGSRGSGGVRPAKIRSFRDWTPAALASMGVR
ncbi:MAG: DUF1329 domain-containing protein [Syntrophales bacterium]|nr:DUF1329 domain-containing protein [Syntrophales bacterium]